MGYTRFRVASFVSIAALTLAAITIFPARLAAEQLEGIPLIPYESVPNFLKYSPEMNLGEVLGVAVNSQGNVMVLNHPGSANSGGPVYGNATSQLLEFSPSGHFIREVGQNVYGLGYSHSIRYDVDDNLWLVDKGAHTAIRFNPDGYVMAWTPLLGTASNVPKWKC